jgi:putative transposase
VKYAFVRAHRDAHGIAALCRNLGVSRSGYYEWRERAPSARSQQDAALLEEIKVLHQRCRGAYGAVKAWKQLHAQGVTVGKHRVARLRAQVGIEANRKRRFRVSVAHRKTAEASPDLLNREFRAFEPDRVWVGDMTFVRTRQGWLHLAMLMDVYSRRVVGWSMSESPNAALHDAALAMAIEQRTPRAGLIHHTDRGVLYRTGSYRTLLQKAGMQQSMSGRKSAYDNAMAESFFSNLKNELVHQRDFATREQAKAEIFDYIEIFYNRQRIHQSLGYQTPAQFEAQLRDP